VLAIPRLGKWRRIRARWTMAIHPIEIRMNRLRATVALVVAAAAVPVACAPAAAPSPVPAAGSASPANGTNGRTMEGIIGASIQPHVDYYFDRLYREKGSLAIDGMPAFGGGDHFVGGKVISAMAWALTRTPRASPEFPRRVAMLRDIVDFVARQPGYETWNHLYALKGLRRLQQAGLLDQVVTDSTLALLKRQLDWRGFVDPGDLHLVNLPTNYYGVAFGIARYRELLGWDAEGNSARILARLLDHVRTWSGEQGFMDETPGEGRFDRYTVLIPAELAILLTDTGTPLPPVIREMLRRSSDIVLALANPRGDGFPYGRSIGLYGDLAALQVLSTAARLHVLTADETRAAYAYNTRMVEKYADFWIDPAMRSIDMWEHGRATDEYRNKGRILGENLSTAMQIVEAAEYWRAAGYTGAPDGAALGRFLAGLPRYRVFRFTAGVQPRALVVARDGGHVVALPLVSGARGYFASTPYLPAPAETGVLETPPNTTLPHLVPRLTLADGRAVMPLVYLRDIATREHGDTLVVTVAQDALALLGENAPRADSTFAVTTTFTFAPGSIQRRDVFRAAHGVQPRAVEMVFLTSSADAAAAGTGARFGSGPVASVSAWGLGDARVDAPPAGREASAPNGPLRSRVSWSRAPAPVADTLGVGWRMTLR